MKESQSNTFFWKYFTGPIQKLSPVWTFFATSTKIVKTSKLSTPVDLVFIKHSTTDTDYSKSPIVILHGIYSCKEHWTKLPRLLAEQTNRTVYIVDLRDHGESPWTANFTFNSMLSDLANFYSLNKIENSILIGHSMGGMLAARFATLFPNLVEKLVLIDIHPKKERYRNANGQPNVVQVLARHFKKSIDTVRSENLDFEAGKERLNKLLELEVKDAKMRKGLVFNVTVRNEQIDWKFNLDALIHFLDTMYETEDVSPDFEGPTFLIYGTSSIFFEKKDCESVQEIFPNIVFDFIENAEHSLQFTHIKEFLSKIVPFINAE